MKLITREIARKLPTIGAVLGEDDPVVKLKFFTPDANWTWYVIGAEAMFEVEGNQDGLRDRLVDVPMSDWADKFQCINIGDAWKLEGEEWRLLDIRFTGFVKGLENECGDFALSELLGIRGRFGLPVERDKGWEEEKLSDVMAGRTN